ncbi:hypothetical protein B0H13DRAFT_2337427 [Mycena leptocephala]|nr:hypothetical protein B0H13DRAFT_2337427 [Mycena leptocephala]
MSNTYAYIWPATLVFFPQQARDGAGLDESCVVQVMMKIESQSRSPTREEVVAFYDA